MSTKKRGPKGGEKRKTTVSEPNDEERQLEDFLFGKDIVADISNSKRRRGPTSLVVDKIDDNGASESDAVDFFLDTKPGIDLEGITEVVDDSKIDATIAAAAWHDDDDSDVEIDINQTNRLKKLKTVDEFNSQMKSASVVVSGAELSSRLRRRFAESNPAKWAAVKKPKEGSVSDTLTGIDVEDLDILRQAGSGVISATNLTGATAPFVALRIAQMNHVMVLIEYK